ncbi:MAG: anti-virulence regulator CigR family protein [Gammaproteobacteria bacterium]
MNVRAAIVSISILGLVAATGSAPFDLISAAHARPDVEKGAGKGKPGKSGQGQGQGKGQEKGQGKAGSGTTAAGSRHAADRGGRGNDAGDAAYWARHWDLGEFVTAGFTSAALRHLLGDQTHLLHTSAKPLPPGIRKNLARGKPLPPGIAKKQPGSALIARLPRVDGHQWLEVGRDLVLVAAGTYVVKEIIEAVFD